MGGCFEIIEESYLGNGESLGEGSSSMTQGRFVVRHRLSMTGPCYAEACGRDSNRFGDVLNGACLGVWSRAIWTLCSCSPSDVERGQWRAREFFDDVF